MRLVEIKDVLEIEPNAPTPIIISEGVNVTVCFYGKECNSEGKEDIFVLKFEGCSKYSIGSPGEETLSGHPYYKLGLESGLFYELINSDLIESLKKNDSVHDSHNPEAYDKLKHYIITFRDEMFECIAHGYNVQKLENPNRSTVEQAQIELRNIAARQA
jgi:hypothetical protein